MQRLEVSGAVRPIYGSLGVKRLKILNIGHLHQEVQETVREWKWMGWWRC